MMMVTAYDEEEETRQTVSMETLEQNFNAQLKQRLFNEVTMETLFLAPLTPQSH